MTFVSSDGSGLHLHHEPELTEAEQGDRLAICDPLRIVLLCHECHSKRTAYGDFAKTIAIMKRVNDSLSGDRLTKAAEQYGAVLRRVGGF